MKNFALTGVAGYIAPRHLKAIHDTGNRLVAAVDPHDSVGILDQYFRDAAFFTEYERFDRHLEKLRRESPGEKVDYVSICSPNHLHDAHIRLALRIGADAICEKPLVLNPWNLDVLEDLEAEFGRRIYTILQLRVHPKILELRERLQAESGSGSSSGADSGSGAASGSGSGSGAASSSGSGSGAASSSSSGSKSGPMSGSRRRVRLTYVTTRGTWYRYSWKGDIEKSGGIATNIGIHFFDLLMWFFGGVRRSEVYVSEPERMGGFMELDNADVQWFLSLNPDDLPENTPDGQSTYRSITVDGTEVEFSGGFTDLHTRVYEETLAGRGFGISDARPSIELVHDLRNAEPVQPGEGRGEVHPLISGA